MTLRDGGPPLTVRKPDRAAEQALSQAGRSDYLPPNGHDVGRRGRLWVLSYLALLRILELVVVMMRSENANQVELMGPAPRDRSAQTPGWTPTYQPADRALLAALSLWVPKSSSDTGDLRCSRLFASTSIWELRGNQCSIDDHRQIRVRARLRVVAVPASPNSLGDVSPRRTGRAAHTSFISAPRP